MCLQCPRRTMNMPVLWRKKQNGHSTTAIFTCNGLRSALLVKDPVPAESKKAGSVEDTLLLLDMLKNMKQ
jgi:hypothetical protein